MRALCGVGLGVVFVLFAVVEPAQELEVVEVGAAVVRRAPVFAVVCLATFGRLVGIRGA